MTSARPARRAGAGPLQVACIAGLWAFHAAAYSYPGRAYFRAIGLNDVTQPVSFNVLLQPALIAAAMLLMIRWRRPSTRRDASHKAGIVVGMGLWLAGATFGWIANIDTPLVSMTYWSVFACGAAIYVATHDLELSDHQADLIFLSLVAGALLPLLLGLYTFAAEWGVPDMTTLIMAHLEPLRMRGYEDVTFGNRGNTGVFLVTVMPPLVCLFVDRKRPPVVRAACGLFLIIATLNLLVIQVRAAFLAILFAVALIWRFRSRSIAGYALFAASLFVGIAALDRYAPEVSAIVTERFQPVLTLDLDDDTSLAGRSEAISEGWRIARRHWAVGIGPGAALTEHSMEAAHQLQVQQSMEAGVLGLAGSTLFVLGLLWGVFRSIGYGPADPTNQRRFLLVIGPTAFAVYGVIANATLNVGYVNTWTVLVVAMLALMPPFPARRVPVRVPFTVVMRRQRLAGAA